LLVPDSTFVKPYLYKYILRLVGVGILPFTANIFVCVGPLILIYNNKILLGNISKLYNKQGTSIIKAITIGNNMVQQNDIN
jgi:hypothetical protein